MAGRPRDSELLRMTLKDLSKALPSDLSSRSTLASYLRWLEIHRQEETLCTNNWPNTILHWTQALKKRGFTEGELNSTVDVWKKDNGPFRSSLRRYPPVPRDIARAFTVKEGGKMEKEAAWGQNVGFEGPPPKNYICNRCGKGGHHVQVCPTNIDPSYDKPPAQDYICTVCNAKGEHYKSLCPKNLDTYSLTQRRKAAAVSTKGTLEQRGNEPETHRARSKSVTRSPTILKKIRDIDNINQRYGRGESVDSDDMAMMCGVSSGKHGREDYPSEDGTISKRLKMGDTWTHTVTIRDHRRLGPDIDSIMGGESAEVRDPVDVTPKSSVYRYSTFVRNLSARSGGHISEIVNPVKCRPTAMDMWEQDEIDRFLNSAALDHEPNQELDNLNSPFPNSSGAHSPVENMSGRLTPYGDSESD